MCWIPPSPPISGDRSKARDDIHFQPRWTNRDWMIYSQVQHPRGRGQIRNNGLQDPGHQVKQDPFPPERNRQTRWAFLWLQLTALGECLPRGTVRVPRVEPTDSFGWGDGVESEEGGEAARMQWHWWILNTLRGARENRKKGSHPVWFHEHILKNRQSSYMLIKIQKAVIFEKTRWLEEVQRNSLGRQNCLLS